MNMKCEKTKDMVLGSFSKALLAPLTFVSMFVERVPVYKLLTRLSNGTTMLLPSNLKRQNVFGFLRNLSVPVFQLTTLYITT